MEAMFDSPERGPIHFTEAIEISDHVPGESIVVTVFTVPSSRGPVAKWIAQDASESGVNFSVESDEAFGDPVHALAAGREFVASAFA
jgi:hypothetical protein